jgi:lambda repressor-like predicted transcriptional regulator
MNRKIRAMMVEKGITNVSIAKQLNVKPSTIAVVANGHGKSERIQKALADALGVTIEELWPPEQVFSQANE